MLFEKTFKTFRVEVEDGVYLQGRMGSQSHLPPLLLLHGHPQTHAIWHRVAPELAAHFNLVMPDLRGYGDSSKPPSDVQHRSYSKRVMASDLRHLMAHLGYEQFAVLAHDRGARVAHRLAVDYPQAVKKLMLLDIAPTLAMYEQTSQIFATAYWHWFFLIQAAPFPESLINANPLAYLRKTMRAAVGEFDARAWAEYERCIQNPETVRAICEDYRAAASIDLQHAREDIAQKRWIECPLHVLWGQHGVIQQCFDPLAEWRKLARHPQQVTGHALACGHYVPEEAPASLLEAALPFFKEGL